MLHDTNLFHCDFFIQTNENLRNWLHFTSIKSMFIVYKQNNRPSGISHLASLSSSLTARIYRNPVLENYAFRLVYLYYTQPFYRTSTFGKNYAYCIRIFTACGQQAVYQSML